jgi:hypothetical protein
MNTKPTKKTPKPGFKVLEFNVSTFVPSMYVFYNYQLLLKKHNFIRDVRLIHRDNELLIRVERLHPERP